MNPNLSPWHWMPDARTTNPATGESLSADGAPLRPMTDDEPVVKVGDVSVRTSAEYVRHQREPAPVNCSD